MSDATAILKVLKQQQSNQQFTVGQLINTVHPEWEGKVDVLQKFKDDLEILETAGFIILTRKES
jgi:hypothetical protein